MGGERVGMGQGDVELRQQVMMDLKHDSVQPRGAEIASYYLQTAPRCFSVSSANSCLLLTPSLSKTQTFQRTHTLCTHTAPTHTHPEWQRRRRPQQADQDEVTWKQIREQVSEHTTC